MNEVLQVRPRKTLRRRLLLTASSAALVVLARNAQAEDRPALWIELGGAFDQMSSDAVGWVPPNLTDSVSNPAPAPFGKPPSIGYDFDAAVSFQPDDSAWIYTASVRYGRAQKGPRHTHDQAYALEKCFFNEKYCLTTYAFLNATEQTRSTHAILDFDVGKDVGLGSFNDGRSTIHFGVRVAQLNERADAVLTAFSTAPAKYSAGKIVHEANALFARSFTGAGPAVSWDGAAPLLGSLHDGISIDWGANAALLFGRQKSHVVLHTRDARYYGGGVNAVLSEMTAAPLRDKTVLVPNVGGFAGLSWQLPNGRVSFGYRADIFFGAIDGGIATSQKDTRGFYGPFANVSVGL